IPVKAGSSAAPQVASSPRPITSTLAGTIARLLQADDERAPTDSTPGPSSRWSEGAGERDAALPALGRPHDVAEDGKAMRLEKARNDPVGRDAAALVAQVLADRQQLVLPAAHLGEGVDGEHRTISLASQRT